MVVSSAVSDLRRAAGLSEQWVESRLKGGLERLGEQVGGPARRRVILLLACVLSLDSADQGAIGAVAPQLEKSLHISNVQLGLLVTVTALVGAAATIPFGNLVDRVQRVPLLAGVILTWGVAETVSAISVNYTMLLGTRVALGVVTAAAAPAVASLTGDFFPAGERGRIYGFIITGELLGAGFGVLVAGLVAGPFGWRPALALLAVPSLALSYALWRYLPEPARGGASWIGVEAEVIPATEEEDSELDGENGSSGVAGHRAVREPNERAQGHRDGSDSARRDGSDSAEPARRPDRPEDREADDAVEVLAVVEAEGIRPEEEIVIDDDPTGWTLRDAVKYVLSIRTNVILIIASSLGYFFFAGLKTFAVLFVRGHYGVSQSVATLLVIVVGAGAVAGVIFGGRGSDRLIARGRATARIDAGIVGYTAAAVLLLPGILSDNLAIAIPLFVVAAAAIAAPNATLDAARLDVVPSQLWGRAEAVRTVLRTVLEAMAPLVFGLVSEQFGSGKGGFGAVGGGAKSPAGTPAQVHGLELAFLIMLIPLAASGLMLVFSRRSYPVDVASAAESQRRVAERTAGSKRRTAEQTASSSSR